MNCSTRSVRSCHTSQQRSQRLSQRLSPRGLSPLIRITSYSLSLGSLFLTFTSNMSAQAQDIYFSSPSSWKQSPWIQRPSLSPQIQIIFPSEHRRSQVTTTTIFQNGQVIRIEDNQNLDRKIYRNLDRPSYGHPGYGHPANYQGYGHPRYGNQGYGNQGIYYFQFSPHRSTEFSVGGDRRQIERFPLNPWKKPTWHRSSDHSVTHSVTQSIAPLGGSRP